MKKEILVTTKPDKFSNCKDKLSVSGIKFKTKIVNNSDSTFPIFAMFFSSSRRARGSILEKENQTRFYYIYVDEQDEEQALHILSH